jgi:hypothetical protein
MMRNHWFGTIGLVIAVAMLSAGSAGAQGNWQPGDFGAFRFYVGLFEPQGDSTYWNDTFDVFTGSPSDFEDWVFGGDYLWPNSKQTGALFGASYYQGRATQAYLDWVDADGQDISHTTELALSDLTAAYIFRFGRHNIRPYLGGGAGLLWWNLREQGYFIDFADEELPVVYASYQSDGITWELIALAGLDFRIGYRSSVFVEGRYRWADDELNNDFAGFGTIDLSGMQFVGGFSWSF